LTPGGAIRLRLGTPADAEVLSTFSVAAYTATFGADFRPDDLEAHLQNTLAADQWRAYLARDRVLIAERAGEIIGYLQIEPSHPRGPFFHRLYVASDQLGQGVGSILLRAGLDDPAVKAAPQAVIDVWEHNAGAIRLYERFGFVATGERMPDFVTASGEVSPGDIIMVRRSARPGRRPAPAADIHG
jgi:ribosomal protein S18 acetylase RimI-like enzyme